MKDFMKDAGLDAVEKQSEVLIKVDMADAGLELRKGSRGRVRHRQSGRLGNVHYDSGKCLVVRFDDESVYVCEQKDLESAVG